jgi:hypothetical protein
MRPEFRNSTPSMTVSAIAPASGLNSRNTPAAMVSSEISNAPKNGPVPWMVKLPTKRNIPASSSIQPTNNVVARVDTTGKTIATMPISAIANPTQNRRREDARSRVCNSPPPVRVSVIGPSIICTRNPGTRVPGPRTYAAALRWATTCSASRPVSSAR